MGKEYIEKGSLRDRMAAIVPYAIENSLDSAYMDGLSAAYELICSAPSEDVKPIIRAEWIPGREIAREYAGNHCTDICYENWHCGHCGYVCKQPYKPVFRYCPFCGAEMTQKG